MLFCIQGEVHSHDHLIGTAVQTAINVYINRILDLIDFMRRKGEGKEVRWRRMKRRRGAMKSLVKLISI